MSKKKEAAVAEDALAAYRRALIADEVEERISELAISIGEYERLKAERIAAIKRLTQEQRSSEDAVVAAYEAARAAGAKVSTLEAINLKPVEAIAAVARRSTRERAAESSKSTNSAPTNARVEAAKVPLTQPSEHTTTDPAPTAEEARPHDNDTGSAPGSTDAATGPVPVAQPV
ncbi:hypothetical protein ACWEVD_01250 [Nocardia thailandica]